MQETGFSPHSKMSNAELLSGLANEIACLRRLATTGHPALREDIASVLASIERIYESLLDDPLVMKDVKATLFDRPQQK